jgi:hypothetical protein
VATFGAYLAYRDFGTVCLSYATQNVGSLRADRFEDRSWHWLSPIAAL